MRMGRVKIEFKCRHCGHCCTDVVCLPTPWDVIRIVRETGEDPHEFLEFLDPDEISGVAKNDPTWLEMNGKRFIMALRRGKRGCYFLKKNSKKCSIYEARPILCRLYPFKLQETRFGKFKGFSLHKDVGCPKHRDGSAETAALYRRYLEDDKHQEDYRDLVEVFNKKEHKNKEPEYFITMFVRDTRKAKAKKGKKK